MKIKGKIHMAAQHKPLPCRPQEDPRAGSGPVWLSPAVIVSLAVSAMSAVVTLLAVAQ